MKKFLAAICAAFYLFTSVPVFAGVNDPCKGTWIGNTGVAMLTQVREELAEAKKEGCAVFVADFLSPGGPVITSIEISQTIKRYSREMIIEIRGLSFIASGGTVVLSAGSKGYRSVVRNSLVLVHGIQNNTGCIADVLDPKTDDDKAIKQMRIQLAVEYAENTGVSFGTAYKWLDCNNTQVGNGELALKLGLVDFIKD